MKINNNSITVFNVIRNKLLLTRGLICLTTGNIFIISELVNVALFLLSKSYSRKTTCKPTFKAKDLKNKCILYLYTQ